MIADFVKEKVFWTRKMNVKLVKFIESRPNIWNPKHPKYTSVQFRDKTYTEFATKFGNAFTGQAVKDRWTNIRSTFANYLRKLNASRAKCDTEEFKINWHLWEPCQFLLKVNKKGQNEPLDGENGFDIKNNPNLNQDDEWPSDAEAAPEPSEDTNICINIANNLAQILKGVQNDSFGILNTKNGVIGQTVSKKLSLMNTFDAATVSKHIMEILLLYDKDNPDNPNNFDSKLNKY